MTGEDHQAGRGEVTWLGRGESLRLLTTARAGRLIFALAEQPTVEPVSFAVLDGHVLLVVAEGSAVARQIHDSIVALEADGLHATSGSGWSVTVTGRATVVTDPAAVSRYRAAAQVPWQAGPRDRYVTISADSAEGRRIRLWPGGGPPSSSRPAPP